MHPRQVFRHYPDGANVAEGEFRACPFCGTQLERRRVSHVLRQACPECGFVQFRNPAPTVGILVTDGDRVLLGKRTAEPGQGFWSLPSGYVEYGEDFLCAAVREVKEETGLDVEIEAVLNVTSSFVGPRWHFLCIYVLARVQGGQLASGDDLEGVEWFPVSGPLPELGFGEDAEVIRLYASGTWSGFAVEPRAGEARG